jgi:hypothetical protein
MWSEREEVDFKLATALLALNSNFDRGTADWLCNIHPLVLIHISSSCPQEIQRASKSTALLAQLLRAYLLELVTLAKLVSICVNGQASSHKMNFSILNHQITSGDFCLTLQGLLPTLPHFLIEF